MKKNKNENPSTGRYMKIGRRLFLAGIVASTTGCQNITRRGQSPDEIPVGLNRYDSQNVTQGPRSIGDICGLYGLDSQRVFGIGVATGLRGTGSAPIESGQREHLLRELKLRKNEEEVKQLLVSKDTELVILEAAIPPGAREGDRVDLRLVTMSESDGTSVENGWVLQSRLRRMANLGNRVTKGNIAAIGQGRVLVNALIDENAGDNGLIEGVILGGAEARESRALSLRIRGDDFDQKTALQIARAVNQRFKYRSKLGSDGVAKPKTDRIVDLQVPDNYRHNIGRYASVLNQLVFAENAQQRTTRLNDLEAAIGVPGESAITALRLEGIGEAAIPVLKRALDHGDQSVRFHAAEALAYLKDEFGIAELVAAAKDDASFRWHAFAALASLEGRASANTLSGLFNEPAHDIRYGAFRALRQQNSDDPLVQGDLLEDDFYLHEVESSASPFIHFSVKDRAEIVVFGDTPRVDSSFLYIESGLTIRGNDDGTITLTGYSPGYTKDQRECSARVPDIIRALADMRYGYGQQLKVLRRASEDELLSCELVVDAAPKLDKSRRKKSRIADSETENPPAKESSFSSAKLFDWIKPNKK